MERDNDGYACQRAHEYRYQPLRENPVGMDYPWSPLSDNPKQGDCHSDEEKRHLQPQQRVTPEVREDARSIGQLLPGMRQVSESRDMDSTVADQVSGVVRRCKDMNVRTSYPQMFGEIT